MKALFFLILVILFSCKKEVTNTDAKFALNHFKATVYFGIGDSTIIDVRGKGAHIGCELLSAGAYINSYAYGVNNTHSEIYASVFFECVVTKGNYQLSCQYYPDMRVVGGAVYQNDVFNNRNGITFTKVESDYYEGFFNAICKHPNQSDSVIVKGTFKGYREY